MKDLINSTVESGKVVEPHYTKEHYYREAELLINTYGETQQTKDLKDFIITLKKPGEGEFIEYRDYLRGFSDELDRLDTEMKNIKKSQYVIGLEDAYFNFCKQRMLGNYVRGDYFPELDSPNIYDIIGKYKDTPVILKRNLPKGVGYLILEDGTIRKFVIKKNDNN